MLSTCFSALDAALLGGLHPGRLYLVASRPSVGKSTLALQIACNLVTERERRQRVQHTLFFSLEDTEESLKAKTGAFIPPGTLVAGLTFQTQAFSFQEISRIAHEHQETKGLDLVILDYIQLMKHDECSLDSGGGSLEQRVTASCHETKRLAKRLGVPVLLLSQVNRGVESRPNKRPLLSDLRESGALAEDPDAVMFLYRDELYNADSPDRGIAEVILAKVRGGECDTVRLRFGGKPPRFSNL